MLREHCITLMLRSGSDFEITFISANFHKPATGLAIDVVFVRTRIDNQRIVLDLQDTSVISKDGDLKQSGRIINQTINRLIIIT